MAVGRVSSGLSFPCTLSLILSQCQFILYRGAISVICVKTALSPLDLLICSLGVPVCLSCPVLLVPPPNSVHLHRFSMTEAHIMIELKARFEVMRAALLKGALGKDKPKRGGK